MKEKPVAAGKSSFDHIDSEKAFDIMQIRPGSGFLDLACGIGRYSLAVAEKTQAAQIYAIDLWQEGIEALKQESAARQLANIHALQADMRKPLPLQNAAVQHCLLATVLHDLPAADQQNVLREIARVLDNDGELSIIEFKKIDHGPGPSIDKRLDSKDLKALADPLGFIPLTLAELGPYVYIAKFKTKK